MSVLPHCDCCKRDFPLAQVASQTGSHCASTVIGNLVVGGYGSVVADMTEYEMVGIELNEGMTICDECLLKMVNDGNLVEVEAPRPANVCENSQTKQIGDFLVGRLKAKARPVSF